MNGAPAQAIALLPLLLLLLLLVGLIFGIILWITSGKGSTKGEMSCGGCGYAVRGLEALNCPECGADLRLAGINRGQGGASHGLGIALTICCGGLLLLSCGSFFFLFSVRSSSSIPSTPAQQSLPSNTATGAQPITIDPAPLQAQPTLDPEGNEPTADEPATDEIPPPVDKPSL